MEDFLIVVLLIAVFWLLVRQAGRSQEKQKVSQLGDLVARLEQRLSRIEDGLHAGTVAAPPTAEQDAESPSEVIIRPRPISPLNPVVRAPAPAAKVEVPPAIARFPFTEPVKPQPAPPVVARPPIAAAQPIAAQPTAAARSMSIEERLGQNWLNKLGVVSLVIGVASFLGYRLRTLGPLGKSAIGMALSLALLVGGLLLERRAQYRIFARAAIGGGWALTFFVTFALYHVEAMQVLHSQTTDLALMFLVAAAMVAHSLHYKSQVVTGLAFLLAFATVGLSHRTLFSLVAGALLAAGLVFVAAREYWFELGLAGLVGVYVNHFLWLQRVLPQGGQPGHVFPEFFASAGLLLVYWLIFRLFYVLRVPRTHREEVVSSLSAILNSVGVMSLLKYQSSHPEWAFRGLLILGVAEFVFAFIARRRWRTAFVVLSSIASVLLLAAIPFHFSGANWPMLWLLQAELLFIAGVQMREVVFRRLGMLAGFAAVGQLLLADVMSIADLRLGNADASLHLPIAIALFTAAAVFWINSEFATRRWQFVAEEEVDNAGLRFTSYAAALCMALALWVCVPSDWVIVAWLLLVLAIGWVADFLGGADSASSDLATQTDLIALSAIVRAVAVNLWLVPHWGPLSMRAITIGIGGALLYAGIRRKTPALGLPATFVPAAYTWAATLLLSVLLWYELQPISIAVAWGVFGLLLFEFGVSFKRGYLRHQGYALLVASFVRIFFANLNVGDGSSGLSPRLYTVLPLIAGYFWVYERRHAADVQDKLDRFIGNLAAWFGTIALGALLYFEVRPEWIVIAWALLASLLLVAAWLLKRTLFLWQSLTVLAVVLLRTLFYSLFTQTPLLETLTSSRVFIVSCVSAVMLLSLPVAFAVRRQYAKLTQNKLPENTLPENTPAWQLYTIYRPEQPFFFVPVLLIALLLAVQLRAGMITIGWSALGVVVFLFALAVKERSYRLAGLSLLMLGVGKIVCVDIWNASPSDRYITLIVMGAALLLVSFLYSRYRETLLKFL